MEHKSLQKIKPLDREVLMKRGYCCGCKCTNCCYIPKWEKGSKKIEDIKSNR